MAHGCIKLIRRLAGASVDFILSDPPCLSYRHDRSGRTVANDDNARWLGPASAEMHHVQKDDSFCIGFYGWREADRFIRAWR